MGGNALKQYETHRLDRDEYFRTVQEFVSIFWDEFGFTPRLIPAYRNKQSFGDADFIINSSFLPHNWIERLKRVCRLDETTFVKNGNVVSIGYDNFQIDLIVTTPEHCDTSLNYFAYNDLGNLIGRIGHKLGIKVGHKGASLIVRHKERSDHILQEILITTDFDTILQMLGLDPNRYKRGFDELEDIYKFVASSHYFDPEIFALEHRSAVSRIRDKKRATYNGFLTWVAETKPEAHHSFGEKSELGGYSIRMPYYETIILARFPWIKKQVDEVIAQFELDLRFKEVYNGVVVNQLTGLTGVELGNLMSKIKPLLSNEVKREWLKNPELVQNTVLRFM